MEAFMLEYRKGVGGVFVDVVMDIILMT